MTADIKPSDVYVRQETTFRMLEALAADVRYMEHILWFKLAVHLLILAAVVWMIWEFRLYRREQGKINNALLAIAAARHDMEQAAVTKLQTQVEKTAVKVEDTVARVEGIVGSNSGVLKTGDDQRQ